MGLNAYSNCSPLTTGCFLYQDSGLTTPVADGVYSDGTNTYTVSGGAGQIASQGTCPTTTTTTTTTTNAVSCNNYQVVGTNSISIEWFDCGGAFFTQTVGTSPIVICAETGTVVQTGGSGSITDLGSC